VGTTHAVNSADPDVSYEGQIAGDLVRRVLIVSPVVILVAALVSGVDGVLSAAIGLVLVSLNFLVSAKLITFTARRSPGAVMGVVLGGYIVRLGVLFAIALALDTVSWIDIGVLLLTVAVVHLALLTWESRHVSLTLGFPGLKPGRQ
jgi:hypothetical protein